MPVIALKYLDNLQINDENRWKMNAALLFGIQTW